ncbi:MAG: sodium:alanine symporter family protein [Verrucomicrobia bacterium]|nr:sodium:alanine symporter family protein [Verrucomicrobiota bacterium]MBS0636831.1 sodium:alanine symporter family protein [Verrucomicrobiota bacterium]
MNELLMFLEGVKSAIWGPPLLALLIGVGIYLTFALRGVQFRYLFKAIRLIGQQDKSGTVGDISPFQSLMTSMASAVGTGSIVGVATALTAGGLGAVFWMWVMSFISMAIKYSESLLAVKYRTVDAKGEMSGGPMYYIEQGLGWKWMATLFAVFASIAAIGTGNLVQVNSIADAVRNIYDVSPWITGSVITIITAIVLFGGIKSIGKLSAWIVPFKALAYAGVGLLVLGMYYEELPAAFGTIFEAAFTGQAAVGGFLGSTAALALQMGVARCVFCSEAGLGIASIASAAAKTSSSGRQALMSMTGTLVSTAIICTITALVIAVTGVLGSQDASGQVLNGASLVISAFSHAIAGGKYVVIVGLILFAYTTVISWAYYGEKCFEYLFGVKSVTLYRLMYVALIVPGSLFALDVVWCFADIMNALMVIPNMIALAALAGVIRKETQTFIESESPTVGTYNVRNNTFSA